MSTCMIHGWIMLTATLFMFVWKVTVKDATPKNRSGRLEGSNKTTVARCTDSLCGSNILDRIWRWMPVSTKYRFSEESKWYIFAAGANLQATRGWQQRCKRFPFAAVPWTYIGPHAVTTVLILSLGKERRRASSMWEEETTTKHRINASKPILKAVTGEKWKRMISSKFSLKPILREATWRTHRSTRENQWSLSEYYDDENHDGSTQKIIGNFDCDVAALKKKGDDHRSRPYILYFFYIEVIQCILFF